MRQICRELMMAGLATPARHQSGCAFIAIAQHKPLDLTPTDAEPFGCTPWHQPLLDDRFHYLQPIQLAHAHGDHPRLVHGAFRWSESPSSMRRPEDRTATFELCLDITTLLLQSMSPLSSNVVPSAK